MNNSSNLDFIWTKIKRSPNKIMRELNRIPTLQARQEQAYQDRLKKYVPFLPKLNREDTKILESLRQDGVYMSTVEELDLPFSNLMLNSATRLGKQLKQIAPCKDIRIGYTSSSASFNKTYLVNFPEIFLWALETRLLAIVENYISLPIIYQGLAIRRDFTDGKQVDVRRWHLDWEDRRTIKIIIYLNDVDINGGPFEYIDKNTTSQAVKPLNYNNLGFVTDEVMKTVVPKSRWLNGIGKAGTLIIADTSSVFHRARPPVKQERLSLSFCYTSNRPKVAWTCRNVSQEQWQLLDRQLNQRQRKCLSYK